MPVLFTGSVILNITSLLAGEFPVYDSVQECPPVQPPPGARILIHISQYSRSIKKLIFLQLVGANCSDGVDCSLVVGQHQVIVHIMRLCIVNT